MHVAGTLGVWGLCPSCRCWFAMRTTSTDEIRLHCPVCGEAPAELEGAAPTGDVPPDVRIVADVPDDRPAEYWLG